MMTSNDDDAPFEPQHGDSSPAIAASAATVAVWNANDILEGVEDIVLSGPSGDADEDSDTSTLQNTPTSLHDQVADLAKKFESALDLPKEWLDPSRALLERFLDLQRPRLDPKMMECFQMNGIIGHLVSNETKMAQVSRVSGFVDLFLSFITRPGPVDESTKGPDDPVAVRRANNATDVLCGVDEWSLQLLETKGPRIRWFP